MIESVKLNNGERLGLRIGRLFVFTDRTTFASLRYGGCMVTHQGRRKVARHWFWRLCWVRA